jgi:hypothetical protein
MTNPNLGVEARLHIVKANRSAIYVMLCRTAAGGRAVNDAVVVIADTSDTVGLQLAEAACEKVGMNIHEDSRQVQREGQIPTAIIVVSLDEAKMLFGTSHPNVASGLDKLPPQGCVRVVAIAAGAAMLLHSDVRPTTHIAEA